MKTIIRMLTAASLIVFSVSCVENDKVSVDNEPVPELIANFFNEYETYTSEKAVNTIFSSNEWISLIDKNERDSLNVRLTQLTGLLGKYHNYEVIKQTTVGDSYKIVSCLAKYDRQPIRFNFILYKPSSDWQIQNFTYDFNIEDELLNAVNLSLFY